MKKQTILQGFLLLPFLAVMAIACSKQPVEPIDNPNAGNGNPNTFFTPIPDNLVGTWYLADNQQPMSKNWEEGSFQGEIGFKEFRTMVLAADGKNAVEYSSEVFVRNGKTLRQMYKMNGTVEYFQATAKLVFHAVSGRIRVFEGAGYTESNITATDISKYYSVLTNIVTAPTVLNAKRNDGANVWSVKYNKVAETGGNATVPPGGPYSQPPTTGSYVQINNQFFPTVTLGNLEWMAVNYYGTDGINVDGKTSYGTFYRFADLSKVPVPTGWRIPTKEDYVNLLTSQSVAFDPIFNSTNGSDVTSKQRLGQLMSVTGWLKQDGYQTNTSGFSAVPANVQVTAGTAHGEGSNCVLWTSERDGNGNYVAFKIIQLPSDTYAVFGAYPESFNPVYAPVRLVRTR